MAFQPKRTLAKVLPAPAFRLLQAARKEALKRLDSERILQRAEQRDKALFQTAAARRSGSAHGTLVIASTGSSNIGDQAMLESVIQRVPGPVTVVTRKSATYVIDAPEVRVEQLGDAPYGVGSKVTPALTSLVELMVQHRHVAVVGADIIDGGYHRGSAYKLWSLAQASAAVGIDTRVLGFSWGETVDPAISAIARRALDAGVRAYCRDSISQQRFQAATGAHTALAADLVFSAEHIANAPRKRFVEQPYALLNVSGLIEARHGLVNEYVEVCDYLARTGRHIVLTPHVANSGGNDHLALQALAKLLDARGIEYSVIDSLLRPAQIAAFAEAAELVVTGRMHLSIISFLKSTPAVVLGTQGKVEGLLKDLGLSFLLVQPAEGMGAAILRSLEQLDANPQHARQQLASALPNMRERSLRNYEGLEDE